jgi:hypothetical protein
VRPSAPPEKKTGRNVALAVVFVVLLAGVIFLGLKMGDLVHGPAPAASSSAPPPATTLSATQVASAPAASSVAPVQTITINPIEMR